jgi:Raf kinase inhibitor-like YbhB/YbcL family protein
MLFIISQIGKAGDPDAAQKPSRIALQEAGMREILSRTLFRAGTSFPVLFILLVLSAFIPQTRAISAPIAGGSAMDFSLHTNAFTPGADIPKQYTCEGSDVSPALTWSAPQGVQSFALITDDPDAPVGTFTHWLIYDIPAESRGLPEGVPKSEQLPDGTRQGQNGFHKIGYNGPCPPPGKTHRYFFKLYALDTKLGLKPGASRQELESALKDHVLATAELMGTYKR